jgi:hypothetical protein
MDSFTVVDHNFPLPGAMTVKTMDDKPIGDVTVRIFTLEQFEAGDLDEWVDATITNNLGEWVTPIVLPEGRSWVVHFSRLYDYESKHIEILT